MEAVQTPPTVFPSSRRTWNPWAAVAWLLGIFGAVIVLLFRRTNHLALFHAKQSLLWNIAVLLLLTALGIVDAVFFRMGFVGFIIAGIAVWISRALRLTAVFVALFMAYQGFRGRELRLPVIGDWAEKIKM
ncbi:MAG: hypothetical protein AAB562_00485 [Patescibacteria group bacterium]